MGLSKYATSRRYGHRESGIFEHRGNDRKIRRNARTNCGGPRFVARGQQKLDERRIALVVLTGTTKWAPVELYLDHIVAGVEAATPGGYSEVNIPFE